MANFFTKDMLITMWLGKDCGIGGRPLGGAALGVPSHPSHDAGHGDDDHIGDNGGGGYDCNYNGGGDNNDNGGGGGDNGSHPVPAMMLAAVMMIMVPTKI